MKWSVPQLRKFKDQSFNIDETVNLPDITDRKDVKSLEEVKITGELKVYADRVDAHLQILTAVNMLDSRTSEDVQLPLDIDSFEVFDVTIDEEGDAEENTHPLIHTLDLVPVVRELIIVNIPNVYTESDEDLGSGKDWTVVNSEEYNRKKEDKVDPRLEKLQTLLDSEDDSKED